MEHQDDTVGRDPDEAIDENAPLVVTVALGVLAAVLVGLSAATTVRAGLASVGVGFVVAVAVLVAAVGVFELGQHLGSR